MTHRDADLQTKITERYDSTAEHYESDPDHSIHPDDYSLWAQLFAPTVRSDTQTKVLDVGSGTGVLTRLLAGMGAHVTSLEPSIEMIACAKAIDRRDGRTNVVHVQGDAHCTDLFPPASFDLIASRQAVCYLRDPLRAFINWRRWLRPNGAVMVIDGLWSREGWGDSDFVDRLPLSCLQTTATLPYLLNKAGFRTGRVTILHEINQRLRDRGSGTSLRYAVSATCLEPNQG